MRDCLVVGRQGAGKTLLSLRMMEQVGVRAPLVVHELPSGAYEQRVWQLAEAYSELVGVAGSGHTTLGIQTFGLGFTRALKERLLLHDSTGLSQGVVEDQMVRLGMARTLERLASASSCLHVMDGQTIGSNEHLSVIDQTLIEFAQGRGLPYWLVVNKIDLKPAREAVKMIKRRYRQVDVRAVSALSGEGMSALCRVFVQ